MIVGFGSSKLEVLILGFVQLGQFFEECHAAAIVFNIVYVVYDDNGHIEMPCVVPAFNDGHRGRLTKGIDVQDDVLQFHQEVVAGQSLV